MDEARIGSAIRAVRIRLGLRQSDVAKRAGVGRTTVSAIELGLLDTLTVAMLRRVAGAVGVSIHLEPRWRGADLARLIDGRHALMVRNVVARLATFGWRALPERTFSVRGERGSIDVLAWHPGQRALLVVEVKTRIVDFQDLLSTADRKRRLAPELARELGWSPASVGAILVLPDETASRNLVARFEPVFGSSFPARTVAVRRWLEQPSGPLGGIWFLHISAATGTMERRGAGLRVRRRRVQEGTSAPRSAPEIPVAGTVGPAGGEAHGRP